MGLELLNPGVELAHQLGQKVVAVILGKDNAEAEKAAIAHGADQVISLEDPAYGYYTTEAYTYGMQKLVEKYRPSILMIGATIIGRDFGPRVSCRLKTGLTADCTSLAVVRRLVSWDDSASFRRQSDGHHHVREYPAPDGDCSARRV